MNFYDEDDPMGGMGFPPGMLPPGMRRIPMAGGASRRFDELYRAYPVAMMPGSERENVNHGGKVIMPPSALDKLTRLHITYPMLFELVNGTKETKTHAGVLEFIAEEGKIYLPYWMMQTLALDTGDMVQILSTDLPPGTFIKLQPQSPAFLDISDPKAVLENAFRNFSCLSVNDIFTFAYNDSVYEIAVKETKPSIAAGGAISVLETDLEVDFETPLGYVEPERVPRQGSGTSTPKTAGGKALGGMVHSAGSMAQAINYASIAPNSAEAAAGAKATSSNFLLGGQKLRASSKVQANSSATNPSVPTSGTASTTKPAAKIPIARKTNGPQPLRLPPGKLFFGYEIKPVRKAGEKAPPEDTKQQQRFQGQGQTLRSGVKRKGGEGGEVKADVK